MPGIARGTVYRNLKLMEQAREIARLEMPDGPDRFDKTSSAAICTVIAAAALQDLPVIGLVREIENAIGTEVRSYQLTIHYICPECREKRRNFNSGEIRHKLCFLIIFRKHSFLFCHHAPKRQKGCRTALQMSRTGDILGNTA